MASNPIYYKDMVSPDDSIKRLIGELTDLKSTYGEVIEMVKRNAIEVQTSMKATSGATETGRMQIEKAAESTSRLEKAQKELAFSMSETGKQVALLKSQITENNKITVTQQKYNEMLASSYDKMKVDLNSSISLYKRLTQEQRSNSDEGRALISSILEQKNQLSALDALIKPHVAKLTELQKAQQKLTFLRSEEGKQLLELRKQIQAENIARSEQRAKMDAIEAAKQKLAYAQSEENQQVKLYTTLLREANEVAKLTAVINNSQEGSYNRLSAQYSLNKIKLNQMSAEYRSTAAAGQALEKETLDLYTQMTKLQEVTGNHRLSVGNYKKSWDGLGMSVSQVVRELPAAAVSLNTFFLGISNNIPILADEIQKLRIQNKLLQQEGKPTKNIVGSIAKAFFSWHTILIVVLTALSMYGKQIITFIASLGKSKTAIKSVTQQLTDLNEELEKNGGELGKNTVTIKKLSDEYKKLTSDKQRVQWIRDNESAFRELDIAVTGVNDAENIFVNNTQAFLNSLKDRAKARAAEALAMKKYEEAFLKTQQAELEEKKKPSAVQGLIGALVLDPGYLPGSIAGQKEKSRAEVIQESNIQRLKNEAKAAEIDAEAFYKLSDAYTQSADAQLEAAGIDKFHKQPKKETKDRKKRDLTDFINKSEVAIQKKYQESITKLEKDEIVKRRKEAFNAYNTNTAELENAYDKNKRILEDEGNEYKKLTDEQKAQIKSTQETIVKTIEEYQNNLTKSLSEIEKDRQIRELKILDETLKLRLESVKKGSKDELAIKLEAIEAQRKLALLENAKLPKSLQQKPSDIIAGFDKQTTVITGEYEESDFSQQQALAEAEFNMIKQNETAKNRFRLQQEKERWEKQIALAKSGAIDMSEVELKTAKATVKGIEREISELDSVINSIGQKGIFTTVLEKLGLNDSQIDALQEAANIVVEQMQSILESEKELAQQAVEAAKERVDAAQKAYDAEVEARNNGYANNVASSKKELEQEKKNQLEKQKLLAAAQKRQEDINTVTQASSLVTASANLWSSFSSIPIIGPALAIAAMTTMWGSFAYAKIKAKQVTAGESQEYGEGGLEILDGGSHASGNDIDLGVKNNKNKNMKAEGGEALAIVNKKNTKKYKSILPDVINSLNKGVFEDKYMRSFESGANLLNIDMNNNNINLAKLEDGVEAIRKQNETKYYTMPNGDMIITYKNTKRTIKN